MPIKQAVLFVVVFLLSVSGVAQDQSQGKYEGYVFEPEYGHVISKREWDLYQGGYQPNLLELQAIRNMFNLNIGVNNILFVQVKTTNSYLFTKKYDEIYKKTRHRELSSWDGVIVYNDQFNKLLLKERSLLPVGRGGYDYYGCIEEEPLFKANIMGGDEEALFIITGGGHYTDNMRGAGARDYLKLHAFGGANFEKLFEVMLLAVNYKPYNPDVAEKEYYFPKSEFSSNKINIKSESGEGRKLYSKLFIKDFDQNNKLDVLIWHREYKSRRIKQGVKPGFDLDKNGFTWYEENSAGSGFDEKSITVAQAEAWLAEYNLTWKQGWPDKSICTNGRRDLPMTVGIDDPILKQFGVAWLRLQETASR